MRNIKPTKRARIAIEALEWRRLLASYVITDYFPAAAGNRWEYDGTYDDVDATTTRTSSLASVGGTKTVRLDDSIHAAGSSALLSRYYTVDKSGISLVRQDNSADEAGSSLVTFQTPDR